MSPECQVLDVTKQKDGREIWGEGWFGAVLSLGVQWCGLLECSQFYKGAISCSIIRQALPTMEMSYWHRLSSRNMRQGWRARDLSWQFYCSHNSVMPLLTGSHPPRLLQTFVTQIALLIRSPSVFFSLFFSEPDLKSLKLIHIFVRAALFPPRRHRHVFVPTARMERQWAEIRFFLWQPWWLLTPALWHWWRWQSCRSA